MASKSGLRKEFLRIRRFLSGQTVTNKSDQIFRNVIKLKELNVAQNFLVYLPVNNEVDTKKIIKHLISQKSAVFVPAFLKSTRVYKVARFTGHDDLEEGPYKIPQPKKPDIADIGLVDVAIVPGVGFSKHGVRLGYGKGVYDQLFDNCKGLKIGLAYDFQVIDNIPRQKHDIVMDKVITESRIYVIT